MKPRELTHEQIQRAVFQHLRERPGSTQQFSFHAKNEGADMRGRMGAIQYGLGMEPGIPDVIVIERAATYEGDMTCFVYCLELKKESDRRKTSSHTDRQEETRDRMQCSGCTVGVSYGLDEAIRWLEDRGLLRGESNA